MADRLISADDLIERAYRLRLDDRERVAQMIESAPTVDADPVRHGTWKERKPQWYCSACEKLLYISVNRPSFNYCPFCGAKMDGGEDG